MPRKRYRAEEIIHKLRETEVAVTKGNPGNDYSNVLELRLDGTTEPYMVWRAFLGWYPDGSNRRCNGLGRWQHTTSGLTNARPQRASKQNSTQGEQHA